MSLRWPLMENNITKEDLEVVIDFLRAEPVLTQAASVQKFEEEYSRWLGARYSVFVNSGSSANLLSVMALKILRDCSKGRGEVIVSPLGWVSDVASVIHCGFKPVFVDINPRTLCMDDQQVISAINENTVGVLLVHVQGFNGLTDYLLEELKARDIPLIEDVSESHGAQFNNQKLGTFGWMSNFSFYYAHHMSTIEGGMICTDDEELYQTLRMLRSHGMVRETTDESRKKEYQDRYPDLNPDFIFAYPAYNMRNTEIGAVLGLNQLKRIDQEIDKRNRNFKLFLDNLDAEKYYTDFDLKGSSNYAFNLILRQPDPDFCQCVIKTLQKLEVEFRRGSAGGGNQLRQPYLKSIVGEESCESLPYVDHIHFYGFYIGNYPGLPAEKIHKLCEVLNYAK